MEIYPKMALGGRPTGWSIRCLMEQSISSGLRQPYAEPVSPCRGVHPLVHEGDPAANNQAIMSVMDDLLYEDFKGMKPHWRMSRLAIHCTSAENGQQPV